MKRFAIFTAVAATCLTVAAQSKIDLPGRLVVNATNDLVSAGSRSGLSPVTVPLDVAADKLYTVIVTLENAASDEDLLAEGVEVLSRRGDMVIARMTASDMERCAAMPAIKQISLGADSRAYLNTARAVAGVDAVQSGEGLGGTPYTGAGVIAGLMDMGLDVNHVNFLDAEGEPRTKALWTIRGETGYVTEYLTPTRIKGFTTDSENETHGTHVLGIMAGSYKGPAEYAFINANGRYQVKKQAGANSAIPYYGVATDAEIAVCCGDFSGSNIELGAELVADYASQQGKPAVINLSVGNNIGPHDGTDASSRYLAEVGKDAIVCVAAGNEGDMPMSYEKTFSASDKSFSTFVSRSATASGMVDFWGQDATQFNVTFFAYNTTTNQIVYSYKIDKNLQGESVTITGDYYTAAGYIHDSTFNSSFGQQAVLIISSNVDASNNRYEVMAQFSLAGSGSTVIPGFTVEGNAGTKVYAYAYGDAANFYSNGREGYVDGTSDCSINGLACGDNILVVGSYDNVESWPTIGSGLLTMQDRPVPGCISSFSSYGATFDGRQLPEICGPGGAVVSSYSTYYIKSAGLQSSGSLVGHYTGSTRDSYWMSMSGTSMATPFVSGVIATWLQADPTLTIADVKEVIKETATRDEQTAVTPERWGYGKIDALAGIKKVLGLSGVSDIKADKGEVIVNSADGRIFEIYAQGADELRAELYSVDGSLVAVSESSGDSVAVDATTVRPGVYVLKLCSSGEVLTVRKLAVR